MGVDPSHIVYLPKKNNWWGPAGQTGPCGPDTEIFYDTGREPCGPDCKAGCDCGKYLEIWNNVFMEYNKVADGVFEPLAQKNVDTGMGLDRTIATLQGVESVYDTDAFSGILAAIARLSGKQYHDDPETTRAFRIVADHVRSAAPSRRRTWIRVISCAASSAALSAMPCSSVFPTAACTSLPRP